MSLRGVWDQLRANYAARPQNEQRIILGLLVAVVLGMVYVGIWVPVTDYRAEVADQIEHGQEELERQARFLGSADSLRGERDALKKKVDAARKELLPGNSSTLGAAALQDLASNAATKSGVTVQSTQVMKDEEVPPFRKVAIRMTLSAELKPLAELVSTLEFTNHLVVPFIEISRRGAVAVGAKGPRTLQATVEVSGFVQAGDGKDTKEAKEGEAGEPAVEGAAPPDESAAEGAAAAGAPAPAAAPTANPAAAKPDAAAPAPKPEAGATTTTAAGVATSTVAGAPPTSIPAVPAPAAPTATPTTAAPAKPAAPTGPTLTTSTIPPPIVIPAAPPGTLPSPPPAGPQPEGEQ